MTTHVCDITILKDGTVAQCDCGQHWVKENGITRAIPTFRANELRVQWSLTTRSNEIRQQIQHQNAKVVPKVVGKKVLDNIFYPGSAIVGPDMSLGRIVWGKLMYHPMDTKSPRGKYYYVIATDGFNPESEGGYLYREWGASMPTIHVGYHVIDPDPNHSKIISYTSNRLLAQDWITETNKRYQRGYRTVSEHCQPPR
jgi:hypothetical protein